MIKRKAVVAGHICIDITPVFPKKAAADPSGILLPGKLVHMDGVDIHTGGAVANTGLAMKLLGVDVCLMGKTGKDDLGNLISEKLEMYGAAEHMIRSEQEQTSYSIVLAIPGIDRMFLHDPGANASFSTDDLDFDEIRKADLFHFGYPTVMRRMYENQGEEMVRMFRKVKEAGAALSLDLAALDPGSEAAREDWGRIMKRTLPLVDFFVPSAEELCFVSDRERYDEWMARAEGDDITKILTVEDVRPLGQKALDMGAAVVLIKCGAPGIYYRTATGGKMEALCQRMGLSRESWEGKEGFEASYVPEAVVSGTGAGDTSIAAFLTSVLEGASLEEALQMAVATGACCVASYDALSGLKPLCELKEKIRCGWKKTT